MDVVLQIPGRAGPHWIDVSIRSAAAARYRAARTAGAPSAAGERDKEVRYGGRALPLVFESRGRLGCRSIESLQSIVSSCAAARLCNPSSTTAWRYRLERAVIFSVADNTLRSAGAAAVEMRRV